MANDHYMVLIQRLGRYLEEPEAHRAKHTPVQAWSLYHHTVPQPIYQAASHLGSNAQDELVLRHLTGGNSGGEWIL